ncbi:hypothetical protein C0J52_17549 [Blattella germanica]|nr:hypothetical protein C0J52_17549 [Blattella germanica]
MLDMTIYNNLVIWRALGVASELTALHHVHAENLCHDGESPSITVNGLTLELPSMGRNCPYSFNKQK